MSRAEALETRLEELRRVHAPDPRLAVWEVRVEAGGAPRIVGQTTAVDAMPAIQLAARDAGFACEVATLPDPTLGGGGRAVAHRSLAHLRRQPSHAAELVSQMILGEEASVLCEADGWLLLQTADGYVAWAHPRSVVRDPEGWAGDRVVTARCARLRSGPAADAGPICDLVQGGRLAGGEIRGGWLEARLPDGLAGWLPADATAPRDALARTFPADGETILSHAAQFLGLPYLWGGTSEKGFDCSGLVQRIFGLHGIDLPRDSDQQARIGEPVETGPDWSGVVDGDLAFFAESEGGRVTHVGIVAAGGRMLHASTTRNGVAWDGLHPGASSHDAFGARLASWLTGVRRVLPLATLVAGLALTASLGCAAVQGTSQAHPEIERSPVAVDFPVSCTAQARAEFNRAVALLHHMTYPQAREAFQRVAEMDPECAMAYWGIAMTLFQPLWPTRPGREELQRGWDAVRKAEALGPATDRERLYVAAAKAFFQDPESGDYWQRIARWERAMQEVHAAWPEDPEAAVFYALAQLAVAPPGEISTVHSDSAARLLLDVYARNPDHPGAMHYLIHANDVTGREHESLDIVRRYETTAPENPHALHMPTHIYTRLGDWDGVIRGNLRAADAALEFPAGDHGEYVWDEFPHAIEYLVYAYLQKGEDDEAEAQVKRLLGTARLQPSFKTAFHLASVQARYALERRAWNEAASLVPREPRTLDWDRFTWPEAVAWFARGLGSVHVGALDEGGRCETRLRELEMTASEASEELFARNIRVLRLELSAWLAHASGDSRSSVALMRQAIEIETTTPKHAVTPAPTLPAFELLGDLLVEEGHPAEALVEYEQSLDHYPRRFHSVLGAARTARSSGDESLARAYYESLLDIARGSQRREVREEARQFVARR